MNCQSTKTGIHQFNVGEGWDVDASTPQKLTMINALASSHGDTAKEHKSSSSL
jgi:hypothetical protein